MRARGGRSGSRGDAATRILSRRTGALLDLRACRQHSFFHNPQSIPFLYQIQWLLFTRAGARHYVGAATRRRSLVVACIFCPGFSPLFPRRRIGSGSQESSRGRLMPLETDSQRGSPLVRVTCLEWRPPRKHDPYRWIAHAYAAEYQYPLNCCLSRISADGLQ